MPHVCVCIDVGAGKGEVGGRGSKIARDGGCMRGRCRTGFGKMWNALGRESYMLGGKCFRLERRVLGLG